MKKPEPATDKPVPAMDKPAPRTTFAAMAGPPIEIPKAPASLPKQFGSAPAAGNTAAAASSAAKDAAKELPKGGVVSNNADKGKADKSETAPADWGLPLKKPRPKLPLKAVLAAVLLLAAAGGYAAYQWLPGEPAAPETAAAAGTSGDDSNQGADEGSAISDVGETGVLAEQNEPPAITDPFDDEPPAGRTEKPRVAASAEPRHVADVGDASPISARPRSTRPVRKNPLGESLALEDGQSREPDEQSEPAVEEVEPEMEGEGPGSGPALELTDEAPRRMAGGRGPGQAAAPGTSITPRDAERRPGLTTGRDGGAGRGARLPDERIDGYRVAAGRTTHKTGGPAISIVEAQDEPDQAEKFDGYEPQGATSRRASSKTLVVRAGDAAADSPEPPGIRPGAGHNGVPPPSDAMDAEELDDEVPSAPRSDLDTLPANRSPAAYGVNPRRVPSPSAAAGDRRPFASSATAATGEMPRASAPVSDTYRVAPDDNFWKISRKQYGSARYYQALMRHNQERVPDPQKLRPGTQILTPPAAVLEQRYPDLIEKPASPPPPAGDPTNRTALRPRFEKPVSEDEDDFRAPQADAGAAPSGYFYSKSGEPSYRVAPDDTLGSIAQRHLGRASRWHEIYEINQNVLSSPDNLAPGVVLRLPSDASRLSLVPERDRRR